MPRLCGVGDEVAAWEPELVVVADAGSEGEQANADPHAEVVQGAGAVSFQAEGALGGLDDRLDALADARDHGCLPGLVFAVGSDDRCAELGCGRFELRAGVALVSDDRGGAAQTASEQADRYLALAAFGRPQGRGARRSVQRAEQMQAHPIEVARMAGAVSVARGITDRVRQRAVAGALDRFARA